MKLNICKSDSYGITVSIKLFGFCHEFHGAANFPDALFCKVLEGDCTAVAGEIHAAVGCCIAMSGECVVGAACVVAGTLARIFSKEDTS